MNREEIHIKLNEIFKDVFGDDELVITDDTTAADVDGWDSLQQILLIETVENEFHIRFTIDEVVSMTNVGDMISKITSKVS